MRRRLMPIVWWFRAKRLAFSRTRLAKSVAAAAGAAWGPLKVLGKGFIVLSILATCFAVYESVAPPEWFRPTNVWYPPAPMISGATVVLRRPVLDAAHARADSIDIRVVGNKLPSSPRSRDRVLILLVRLANQPGASWQVGLTRGDTTGTPTVASFDAPSASRDNWEIVGSGLRCDQDYAGDVEARVVSITRSQLQGIQSHLDSDPLAPADVTIFSPNNPQSNPISATSPGVTPGVAVSPYRQVARLAANLSLDSFAGIIGAEPQLPRRRGRLFERVFVAKDYYVYTVANQQGTVLLFLVTTRNQQFKPVFIYSDGESDHAVQLGVTHFSALRGTGGFAGVDSGTPSPSYLYTTASPGNPSNYQDYFFGWNDSGYPADVPDSVRLETFDLADSGHLSRKNSAVAAFIRDGVVNTWGLSAPGFSIPDYISSLPEWEFVAGVNRVDVRVIPAP